MGASHRVGRRGEAAAARCLEDRGWHVLDRNWRAGHAELDLVVRKMSVVAFVEVKTRWGRSSAPPLAAITDRKRREVERAAAAWIRRRGSEIDGVETFRFDAVAVRLESGRRVMVRHVPDAWRIGGG